MNAQDLAREVVAYNNPRDRPSSLVLVVFCRSWRGRDVRNENHTMRITAPIEDGRILLRIVFPTIIHEGNHTVQTNKTVLEYDATSNTEGAASCIEGFCTCRDNHEIIMFKLLEDGELGAEPLTRWSLSFPKEKDNQTTTRLQIIQQILRSLLVM